jgi:hypothetical protein
MTSHSHTQRLMPMQSASASDHRIRPRTVLVAFLVAVTIVVALSYAIRSEHQGGTANQPTATWTGSQAPPGIWTASRGPVE